MKKRVAFGGDPKLQELYPERCAAMVTVRAKDGRVLANRVDFAKGTPENPLTEQELKGKFTALVMQVIPTEKADRLWRSLNRLEKVSSVATLGPLLRA